MLPESDTIISRLLAKSVRAHNKKKLPYVRVWSYKNTWSPIHEVTDKPLSVSVGLFGMLGKNADSSFIVHSKYVRLLDPFLLLGKNFDLFYFLYNDLL